LLSDAKSCVIDGNIHSVVKINPFILDIAERNDSLKRVYNYFYAF